MVPAPILSWERGLLFAGAGVNPNGFSTPDLPPALLALGRQVLHAELVPGMRPADIRQSMTSAPERVAPYIGRDRAREIAALEADAESLRAAAEGWLAGMGGHPWIAPFRPDDQGWVGHDMDPPSAEGFTPPPPLPLEYLPFSCGMVGASTTTMEDGDLWPVPDESRTPEGAQVWRLAVPASARVLEIRTCDDWAGLVAAHPRLVTDAPEPLYGMTLPAPLIAVDWASAAEEWDGVRMTYEGLLRVSYVELPAPGGSTVFMPWDAGWERTLWLRWIVPEAVPLGPWVRHEFDPPSEWRHGLF